jgi:hypothetical protein
MKMVKKVLMGLALAGAVLALAGCVPQADDTEKAIKKNSLTKYTVDYKNEGDAIYRAYKNASTAHAGALVKVVFDETDDVSNKMGVIFNLKETKDKKVVTNREFYIIGLASGNSIKNFYVSKFTNVTDIKAENFGTKLAENKAKEVEIVPLADANKIAIPDADAEGKITMWVYFKADKASGGFDYAVIKDSATIKNVAINKDTTLESFAGETVLASGNTHKAGGSTKNVVADKEWEADATDKEIQNGIAFYAMIQPGKTLIGNWELPIGKTWLSADAE